MSIARHTQDSINNVVNARTDGGNGRAPGDSFYGDQPLWIKPFASRADLENQNGGRATKPTSMALPRGLMARLTQPRA